MIKSYSEASYGDHFSVDFEDAQQLYDRIKTFIVLTREMCEEKIQSLENDATSYKRIPQEKEVING